MNAEEVIRALRNCKAYKTKSDLQTTMLMAADLIESLQADLRHEEKVSHGQMEQNKRLRRINENLQEQLAASQRRERAAVEDLKMVCISGEPCTSCKECRNMGDRFPCALGEWCGGTKWQWRGPQEAGEGRTNNE